MRKTQSIPVLRTMHISLLLDASEMEVIPSQIIVICEKEKAQKKKSSIPSQLGKNQQNNSHHAFPLT
jgi:hypothetical protein